MTQESKVSKPVGSDAFPMLQVIIVFAIIAILEVYFISVNIPGDHIALSSGTKAFIYSDYVLTEPPAPTEVFAVGKKKRPLPIRK